MNEFILEIYSFFLSKVEQKINSPLNIQGYFRADFVDLKAYMNLANIFL